MSVSGPLGATPQGGAYGLRTAVIRTRSSRYRAYAGIVGLSGVLLSGGVIALAASGTDLLLPESVRPIPTWLAGPFGTTGLGLGHAGLIIALFLMSGFYVLAVTHAGRLSGRAVLASIAGLYALVLLAPPLLSTDLFSYQSYARMEALYGANPYLSGPHAIALDPLYAFVGAKWVTTPTAYGPLFTALSYPFATLDIAASAVAFKAIAAVSSLVLVAIVWNAARLRGLDPVRATVLVGLNPLLVIYGIGGGHNDLLMLAVLCAGLLALLRQRDRAAGALTVVAVGIKLTAGLMLPFAVAGRPGRRRDLLTGAGVAGAALAVLAAAMFGAGPLHLLATLQHNQANGDWHSIPGFISTRLGFGNVGHVLSFVLAGGFVVAFCLLLRKVWRGEMDWIAGVGWATAAMLLTAGSLLPWYVAWILPFAALAGDRRLRTTAIALTCLVQGILLIGYVPH
ncbi:MAG TPA: polyprenol phosphomannose-dependent alpha 1,6 mannosyltransferase MptB [Solirubrobacteraceae bacterium]|nr:polyprenol phosphomannose-dependent alpha 1,6 mannosyltransferase MptB [Solirubrobacteraceae bacterium]